MKPVSALYALVLVITISGSVPLAEASDCVPSTDATTPVSAKQLSSLIDAAMSVGKDILGSTSVAVGVTQMQRFESSIWWQSGLPDRMQLTSPSANIQINLKASSIPGANKIQNPVASAIIKRTSFNVGYYRFCLEDCSSDAQATSSGYSDPRTNPIYQWTGKGYAHGGYFTVQEELPFHLLGKTIDAYAAAGVNENTNQWKMVIHSATCTGAESKMNCPKIGREVVYDEDGSYLGERVTLGAHLGEHGSVELSGTNVGEPGWSDSPTNYPPIWRNWATSLEYRFGFK
jgi:hypothetical protein